MNLPLLTTKLYMPSLRPEFVARTRLNDRLTAGLGGRLTLVCAPAGYGKSTLLSAWLSALEKPVAWLSLDEGDNDLTRFLDYLVAALGTIAPQFGTAIPSLQGASEADAVDFILTSLINEVSAIPDEILLVLDDYHAITTEAVHGAIMFLLDHIPPNLHLVIASRTDPPLRVASLRAKGELSEIRAQDLRFTRAETVAFLNTSMDLGLSPDEIDSLLRKTEGWIAGLQLAGLSLQSQTDRSTFVQTFSGDDRHIADYLFEEVLRSLPEDLSSFLLQTCILDRFCAGLCTAVTGRDDSEQLLSQLEAANLFLIPQDNRRQWYRYHHLFAYLLNLQLKTESPNEIPALHIKASQWYEKQDMLSEAIMHTIRAGDISRLESLVQANTLAMLELGESALVDRWLNSLPPGTVEHNLWLAVAKAWATLFSGRYDAARDALRVADRLVSSSNLDLHQILRAQGQIAVMRAYLSDLGGEPDTVESYAREALEMLPAEDCLAIALASMLLATAYFRRGNTSRAEIAVQEALNACVGMPHSFVAIDAICMLSTVQYLNGQLHESVATLRSALEVADADAQRGRRRLPIMGLVHVYLAQRLFDWNRLDEAMIQVEHGLRLLEPWGYQDCIVAGYFSETKIAHALGDDIRAFKALENAKQIAGGMPYWRDRVEALEAWLNALAGEDEVVNQWLREQHASIQGKLELHLGLSYRYLAKIHLIWGEYELAASFLRELLDLTEQEGSRDRLLRVLVLLAVALASVGEQEQASAHFQRALELAEPGGYVRVFLDEGQAAARLLYQTAQAGFHTEYCLRLLDEFPKQTQLAHSLSSKLVESLSEREIEVLVLISRGCTNQEIAQELILSIYTVKSHARNIYGKLGVKNRTEAVARGRLLGLLAQNGELQA